MRQWRIAFVINLLFVLVVSFSAQAQVSFFQPPLYSGTGNVFVADFNGDGKPDILCSDGTLNLGNGDGTFTKGTSVTGYPLAVADFNGDGRPDILEQTTGTLVVLLGNGDGTFQAPINTASGATLSVLAAGNFTSSNKADVIGIFNNMLMVYISNGDGTFAKGVSYALGANAASSLLSLGDFNGDSNTDVVVTTFNGSGPVVDEITFLGKGDGTFQPAKITSGLPNQAVSVAAGDFNGDGKLDLAIDTPSANCSSFCAPGTVYLMLGNGDGTFQAPQTAFSIYGGNQTAALAAADLNGDGKLDLVLETPSVAQVFLGNGDGTFSNASNYVFFPQGLSFPSSGLAIADFNGDKKSDLAVGNATLLGNGDGTFQGIPIALLTDQPSFAAVGKFNKSGTPGVATVSGQVTSGTQTYSLYILSNNGGVLSLAHTYALQNTGQIVTADLNGDGNLDLVVSGTDPTTQMWSYSVLLGNGDGSFQAPVYYPQNVSGGSSVVVADFNNDHKPDLAVAAGSQTVAILLGNGDGTFAAPVYYYDAGGSPLLVADFNGDGKLDIAAGNYGVQVQTAILLGNGDGTFQAAIFPASLNGFLPQFTADLNNDGIPDLLSFGLSALGNGDATFTLMPPIPGVGMGGGAEAVGDLNGDGIPDLFVYETTCNFCAQGGIQLGNGDGTFGSIIEVPTTMNFPPHPVLLADMNGDGLPDVVFLWPSNFTGNGPTGVGVLVNTTQVVAQPNFQVLASELSPSPVTAGGSATSTVTINPLNGFVGSVALSCSGLPSGASCGFNPTSISSGSGSSVLTVTSPSTLSAGSYPFTVTGSSSNLSRIVVLTLIVASGSSPDFQISSTAASPTSVAPGGSATSTVTITALGGFGNTVNLACESPMSGVTCALSPTSVTPSTGNSPTSTLTISTTASVAVGNYTVTVFGTAGSSVHSAGVILTVSPDFTIGAASGSPTSQTIAAGQSAQFALALALAGPFTETINLTCSIAPVVTPAPTCTLPGSVQISNGGTQTFTVTVGTTASITTGSGLYNGTLPPLAPLAWTALLLGTVSWLVRSKKRQLVSRVPLLAFALCMLTSCGGSSSRTISGTPPGTYTATVTATSGTVSHNMTLQVIVH